VTKAPMTVVAEVIPLLVWQVSECSSPSGIRARAKMIGSSWQLSKVGTGRFVELQCANIWFGWAAALEKADGPFWVATRPSSRLIRRRKAVSEVSLLVSGH